MHINDIACSADTSWRCSWVIARVCIRGIRARVTFDFFQWYNIMTDLQVIRWPHMYIDGILCMYRIPPCDVDIYGSGNSCSVCAVKKNVIARNYGRGDDVVVSLCAHCRVLRHMSPTTENNLDDFVEQCDILRLMLPAMRTRAVNTLVRATLCKQTVYGRGTISYCQLCKEDASSIAYRWTVDSGYIFLCACCTDQVNTMVIARQHHLCLCRCVIMLMPLHDARAVIYDLFLNAMR